MNITNALNRNSVFAFIVFLGFTVLAFWPSYFSRLDEQPTYHFHAHGIAMLSWLGLLVTQALLIRNRRRPLHRRIGKLSYVLAPALIIVTLNFMHFRLQGIPPQQLPPAAFYFIALIFNALVAFALLFGLAIYHRHNAPAHARYMVATLFPLFTPVTDRLIGAYVPSIVGLVPRIAGTPILPVAGFLLAELILLILSIFDMRSQNKTYAFPIAFMILLVYHVSVLTFHNLPAWQSFCRWLVQLPLS